MGFAGFEFRYFPSTAMQLESPWLYVMCKSLNPRGIYPFLTKFKVQMDPKNKNKNVLN